jgi:hypothetical protein
MTQLREDVAVTARVTFLVDVDNTLLDNDRIRDDFEEHLRATLGDAALESYWTIQERRFVELGYRDYLGAAHEWWTAAGCDPALLPFAEYLLDYPYAERLYPRALEALARLRELGPLVVLTDGDAVFQPRKVSRAGILGPPIPCSCTSTRRRSCDDVERRHPARHYVLVDDKLRILTAAKAHWGDRSRRCFHARASSRTIPRSRLVSGSGRHPRRGRRLVELDVAALADG